MKMWLDHDYKPFVCDVVTLQEIYDEVPEDDQPGCSQVIEEYEPYPQNEQPGNSHVVEEYEPFEPPIGSSYADQETYEIPQNESQETYEIPEQSGQPEPETYEIPEPEPGSYNGSS